MVKHSCFGGGIGQAWYVSDSTCQVVEVGAMSLGVGINVRQKVCLAGGMDFRRKRINVKLKKRKEVSEEKQKPHDRLLADSLPSVSQCKKRQLP